MIDHLYTPYGEVRLLGCGANLHVVSERFLDKLGSLNDVTDKVVSGDYDAITGGFTPCSISDVNRYVPAASRHLYLLYPDSLDKLVSTCLYESVRMDDDSYKKKMDEFALISDGLNHF